MIKKFYRERKEMKTMNVTKEVLNECKKYKDTIMDTVEGILKEKEIKYEVDSKGFGIFVEENEDTLLDMIVDSTGISKTVIKILLLFIPAPNNTKMCLVRLNYK